MEVHGLDEAALARRLQDAVEAVEQGMSPWRESSEVLRFNGAPVEVDPAYAVSLPGVQAWGLGADPW